MLSADKKFKAASLAILLLALFDASNADAFFRRRGFRPFRSIFGGFRPPVRRVVRRTFPTRFVRTCDQFRCTIQRQPIIYGRSGGYRNGGHRNNRIFVNNRFDPNRFDQVDPRFNTLRAQNGVLFAADPGGRVVAQLFIDPRTGELLSVGVDRNGNVRGFARPVNTNGLVFAQLARFYFDNLDKFKTALRDARLEGNRGKINNALRNLQLVNSFLGFAQKRLGIRRNGRVNFDIGKLSIPANYLENGQPRNPLYTAQNLGTAALNYTLNMLTNRCENLCVGLVPGNAQGGCQLVGRNIGAGIVSTDLSGFFNDRTINFMTNAIEDPYACGDARTIRADYFIAAVLGDPRKYKAIKQIPGNYEEYALNKGTDPLAIKEARARQAKMVVGPGESRVAHRPAASRTTAAERQDRVRGKFGGSATGWMSFDYNNQLGAGLSRITGTGNDLIRDPVGSIGAQAGGEAIFEQCNGMHEYTVMDGNGNFVDEVPGSIARGPNAISGNAVANPLSCTKCHQAGFISGSQHPINFHKGGPPHKTNPFANLGAAEAARARALGFRTVAEMRAVAARDNQEYFRTLQLANAYIPEPNPKFNDVPAGLPFDIVQEYYKPLDDEKLSRELGVRVTVAQLANLRGRNGARLFQPTEVGSGNNRKLVVDRDSFAGAFCELKAIVLGQAARGGVDTGNGQLGVGGNQQLNGFTHNGGRIIQR